MGLTIDGSRLGMTENSAGRIGKNEENQKAKTNVFGGDLNLAEDPVAQKRREAQQKAMKVVQSAWNSDRSVDEAIQSRKDHYKDMESRRDEAQEAVSDINMDKAVLKELYGVSDDSQEQQDLELLEKRQDIQNQLTFEPLTEEELNRLAEIDKSPLTEYQQRGLELNRQSVNPRKEVRDLTQMMSAETANIRKIELERLKTHGMVDAQKAAKAIGEAAADEIVASLVGDAVDHMDEKLKESEETAEEQAQSKEEREEQLDELQAKRAMEQALIEGTKEAAERAEAEGNINHTPDMEVGDILDLIKEGSQSGGVQQSLNEIKSSMKLLEADLKGIEVDKQV